MSRDQLYRSPDLPMHDLIRDSTIGQIINYASRGRFLPYADQRPEYVVPSRYLPARENDATTLNEEDKKIKSESTTPATADVEDPYLVDWEENDTDNPRNWSFKKRAFVNFAISLLTFSMYIGSAIYTASILNLMEEYNVSFTIGTLGLTLYVLGYGVGPMFLAFLQEIPAFGRNPIYIGTLFIFVILQISLVTAKNMNTVLALRFLTGFFGSPALSTGGASISDVFPMHQFPYVLGVWSLGATAGPIMGPVIGGFAAQAKGWRWPMLELLWIASFSLIFLALLLPETNGPTVLLRRAERLRRLTGNKELRTATERQHSGTSEILYEALVRPFILAAEPVLMFANLYLGFVYGLFYIWFEAFPLVFNDIYHFNEGVGGLPYLGFLVSGTLGYVFYCIYHAYHIAPRYMRAVAQGKSVPEEIKLELGLIASILVPTSVLTFGFTAKASIHWMAPIIGASLYFPAIFLIFQSILAYITGAYPEHKTAVLTGNVLFRASIASVFPLFGRGFFHNLGLGGGSGLLAGLSFALMGVYCLLLKYAHILRRRSKYAVTG
ncbi:putative caffeine resistance protein [Roridomyces roridus]|uniref:Caffeine resistance protein n=1 Tax=Roridomyces roridus TaxID=1738132 RepID=A0AAD7C8N8_9AGAR|nr:putative caffeine resistance protein [Roridomyces roridus]